jgi:hypothetical protein
MAYEIVDGQVVLPDPDPAKLDAIYAQIVMLSATGKPVNIGQLRPFNPDLPRIQLAQHLQALIDSNRLTKSYKPGGKGVQLEYFSPSA